ncbi:integrase core domain-containing protein [Streptomyces sp. NPDC047009]|uniref:integrase core domain-containing protein n=1 Tax=Streptomyces sp. NPDC047009 TaxID=3154496 RepID=UPI0033CEE4B9
MHDRDDKYGEAFDAILAAEEMEILKSAPRVPRMNAHCERIISSIRREALDHVLTVGEAHARQVLATYKKHYNAHRPHRARDLGGGVELQTVGAVLGGDLEAVGAGGGGVAVRTAMPPPGST